MNTYKTNGMLIVERIDQLLSERNENRVIMANSIDVTTQTISHWFTRGTIPAADIALKIADYLNVSIEFLLYGIEKDYSNTERDLISRFRELSAMQQEAVISVIQTFENQNLKNTKAV